MRVKTLLPAVSLASALLLGACGGGDGESAPAYDWSSLATTLDGFVGSSEGKVSGYSFALAVGGHLRYTRAGGDMAADAVIPIASASKAPSATVILSLVKDGLLDLDTPVADYLGDVIAWPLAKRDITLRMLLNHTSGLPFSSPCMDDDNTTLQACTQEIADTTLNSLPGNRFGYSGAGYQVAGFVATHVSGKSWQTLVQERLAGPLGMSTFSYGDTQNPRIGGGAVASATDYLKFAQLYLNGGSVGGTAIVSAAQVETAKTSQIEGLPVYYTPVPDGSGLHGYSFGWWISDAAQHPGSAGPELSDPGLLGATPWLDFDQRYTAVVLLNSTTDNGVAMWNAARPDILAQLNPPQP
ncbi:serine hydrolase domain-containing protein [Solimonas variicoloris]|uniref:serine hydrolase domain-containing protein n=1 Tax=Solimonas variicoloris TaxID=254408 RepID=UPI000371AC04|nr:serine hydrolase domain-containing protein [Solimonas variicoloris]